MRRELSISIVDQAMMSGFSLVLNLAMIALATPQEFGFFAIILAGMLVLQAGQDALISQPLNILLPGRDQEAQERALDMLSGINRLMVGAALSIACALAWIYSAPLALGTAIAFFLCVTVARNYTRAIFIVRGQVARTFVQDVVFILVTIFAGALLWKHTDPVTSVVAGLGIGNVAALAACRPSIGKRRSRTVESVQAYRDVWTYTKWALLSGMQTEGQTRGYIFIAEAWKGAATLGLLQVGRMLLAPLSLIATAWGRIARPRMVAHFHHSRPREAYAILGSGVLIILVISLLYGSAVAAAWSPIEQYIFRGRYGDMGAMAALWWLYTTVFALNSCAATLLEVQRRFRALAMLEMVTTAVCLGTLIGLSLTELPTISVVITLVVVQILYGAGMLTIIVLDERLRERLPGSPLLRSETHP